MKKWFKRVYKKFSNATKGFWIILKEETSLWVHFFVASLVVLAGIVLELNPTQWALLFFAFGLVIGFEIINTAIEYLVDIVSFEYNIKAKKIKDVAAFATLFVTFIAIVIGLLVFIPAIQDNISSIKNYLYVI